MPPKKVEQRLAELTREFFARHPGVKLVAVTGSAGKTSTKISIGTVLSQQYTVQLREEAPQTKSDVFLQIMGVTLPDDNSRSKWKRVIEAVEQRVNAVQPEVQVIVQEFSPEEPGDNEWFKSYLLPDITVVTAVTDGRMQVKYPVETVASEMISLANNSKTAMINRDDVEGRFASYLINPHITTYGVDQLAEYYFEKHNYEVGVGYYGKIVSPENPDGLPVTINKLGEHNLRPAVVAAAVGYKMGVTEDRIAAGLAKLHGVAGRMNVLRGGNGSWLIDDSYSASPNTALWALQTLYSLEAPQRIAVFGNMNGLRGVHELAHQQLGGYCNIEMLDWVVTVGGRANLFLAPAARRNGCQVKECVDAIEAGAFVRDKLKAGGIALFKGSSGGVWLEEAVKLNLLSASDSAQLVRQDPAWLERKQAFFTANRSGDAEAANQLGIDESEDDSDGQAQPIAPGQPAQQQLAPSVQPGPQPAPSAPSRGSRSIKSTIIKSIFGALTLAAIISAVLIYFLWWQSPQKMITDALAGIASSGEIALDSKIELDIPGYDYDIELIVSINNGQLGADSTMKVKSEVFSQDIELDLDLVSDTDGSTYFKLGKIDNLVDLYIKDSVEDQQSQMEEMTGDIPENYIAEQEELLRGQLDPVVENINSEWVKVSRSYLENESSALACSVGVIDRLHSDKGLQQQVVQAYKGNEFLVVKDKVKSRNGGTGFEIDLADPSARARLQGFSEAIKSSAVVEMVNKCGGVSDEDSTGDQASPLEYAVKVWVHPFSHQLTALEVVAKDSSQGLEMKFTGDFQIGTSQGVETPSDTKDIEDVSDDFTDLLSRLQSVMGNKDIEADGSLGVTAGSEVTE